MSEFQIAKFTVTGVTDLMFGRKVTEEKKDSETHAQYELRTWRGKCRIDDKGQLYLNPFAATNSLVSAGKWLARKVPGEGKKTFTARFQQGVAPRGHLLLFDTKDAPLTIDNVDPIMLFVPSDGKHGGPKRVERIFPTVHDWRAKGACMVLDGKITVDQLRDHLEAVGRFIGWGSMRVEGGGINGRFMVEDVVFENET